MDLIGYLFALSNLQMLSGAGGTVKDLTINVGTVDKLAREIQHEGIFPIEGFRNTGFYRVGEVGKYLSNNLRSYIYNGARVVDPNDEGVIITIYFTNDHGQQKSGEPADRNEAVTFFVHRNDPTTDYSSGGKRSFSYE